MNDEQIKKMIEDTYDDSKEDTLRTMIGQFYSRKRLSTIILLWSYGLAFMALAIFSAVKFFHAETNKSQIMYAALFICCIQFFGLIKIFAWQLIHKIGIRREIKRLEIRIADLSQTVQEK
jgi:hypothetical protein